MKLRLLSLTCFLAASTSHAQVFDGSDSAAPGSPAPTNTAPAAQPAAPKSFLGNDVPFVDPGSEMAQWDGKMWNISNNRLFRARFEKYLAAPEESTARDQEYRQLLLDATKAMSPSRPGGPSVPETMRLLVKAADFPIDARLCDSLAQAVYGVVLQRKNQALLAKMNKELEKERHNQGWNMEVAAGAAETRARMNQPAQGSGGNQNQTQGQGQNQAQPRTTEAVASEYTRVGTYIRKMVEIDATRVANAAKMSAGELKSKVEFQALIVQFFLQRRFEHTILACRLYRNLYEDGDSELKLKEGSDVEKMFTRTTGTTPTVSALDALASEFIRDVDEGVVAFEYLADKGELESASKRLSEAFVIGEYLPRMRTLPRSQKEKALAFVRDSNQLISAIEVKDYSLAEEIVERLRKNSRDFDYSKPRAAIETARAASSLHIQNARSAAIKKDDKAVAEEIQKAALIWPTNPDLKAFATQVATYGDMNSRVLNDLDTLLAQKNYREIAREHVKYSGAVLGKPEYEQKLKAALEKVAPVDRVTTLADEMVKAGDSAGAWERLEEAARDYPDDNELNRRRAELAGRNAEFIHAINEARKHEDSGRTGVSLSWFLRAERLYPNSLMARKGIDRLADRILPESAASSNSNDNPVYAAPPTSTASDPSTPPANPFPGESTQN